MSYESWIYSQLEPTDTMRGSYQQPPQAKEPVVIPFDEFGSLPEGEKEAYRDRHNQAMIEYYEKKGLI